MVAETEQERASTPESRPGDGPGQYDGLPASYGDQIPPQPSDAPQREEEPIVLSGFSTCLLVFVLMLLLAAIFTSPRPSYSLLFAFLAILPAIPVALFILRNFKDPVVNRSYLLSQFCWGAVPVVMLVAHAELILSALIGAAVFSGDLKKAQQVLDKLMASSVSDDDNSEQTLVALVSVIPLWKILLYFLLVAFITAGMVEEVGKWLLARRYRKLAALAAEDERGPRIGCRGVLASACAGALGFAMTENVVYVLSILQAKHTGFSFRLAGLALLRGVLAYPVHVGTQFYVGVTAAQRHILSDRVSIALALFVAVLFHGTFDAVAFVCMVLIGLQRIPEWIGMLVPVFDLVLIGFLLLLCRSRYKALLERERVLTVTPV